jgi:hypothetical protein
VVNIQGDEPLIEPECIDAVVTALQDSPDAVYRWVGGFGVVCVCVWLDAYWGGGGGGGPVGVLPPEGAEGRARVSGVLLTWVFAEACKGPIGPLTASHIPSDPALRCSTACTPLAHAEVPLRQRVKCITGGACCARCAVPRRATAAPPARLHAARLCLLGARSLCTSC